MANQPVGQSILLINKKILLLFIFVFIFFQDSLYAKSPVYNGSGIEYDEVLKDYDFNNPYNAKSLNDTNSEDLCVESDKGDGSLDCVQPNKPTCCPKGYTLYVGYDACKSQNEEANENLCDVSAFENADSAIKSNVTCCVKKGLAKVYSSSSSSVSSSSSSSNVSKTSKKSSKSSSKSKALNKTSTKSSKSSVKSSLSKSSKKSSFSSIFSTSNVSNTSKKSSKSSSKSKALNKTSTKSSKSSVKSSSSKSIKKSNSSIAKVVSSSSQNSTYLNQSLNRRSLNLLVKEKLNDSLRAQMNIDSINNYGMATDNMYSQGNNSEEESPRCFVRGPIIDKETQEYKQGYKKCKRCSFCVYRDLSEETGKPCECTEMNCTIGTILYDCSKECSQKRLENFKECEEECETSRLSKETSFLDIIIENRPGRNIWDDNLKCRCRYGTDNKCRHHWANVCLEQDLDGYDVRYNIPSSTIIPNAKDKSESYIWLYVDKMGDYINSLSESASCDEIDISTSDHSGEDFSSEYLNLFSKCTTDNTNVCGISNLGCSTFCSRDDKECQLRIANSNINTNVCNQDNDNNSNNLSNNSNNSNDSNHSDDNNNNNDACSILRENLETAIGRKLKPNEIKTLTGNSVTGFSFFEPDTPYYTIVVSSNGCKFMKPTCMDWIGKACKNDEIQDIPRCVNDEGKEYCLHCLDSGRWSIGDCLKLKTCSEAWNDSKCGEHISCTQNGFYREGTSTKGCKDCDPNKVYPICNPERNGCDYDCFDPDKKICVKRKCGDGYFVGHHY